MNREIKFRAWDGSRMSKVDGILNHPNRQGPDDVALNAIEADGGDLWEWHEPPVALMQYTGIKDVNGVEIYESDIVRENDTGHIGTVYWEQWGLGQFTIKTSWTNSLMYDSHTLEIIGNLYEHPHLIEDKP